MSVTVVVPTEVIAVIVAAVLSFAVWLKRTVWIPKKQHRDMMIENHAILRGVDEAKGYDGVNDTSILDRLDSGEETFDRIRDLVWQTIEGVRTVWDNQRRLEAAVDEDVEVQRPEVSEYRDPRDRRDR